MRRTRTRFSDAGKDSSQETSARGVTLLNKPPIREWNWKSINPRLDFPTKGTSLGEKQSPWGTRLWDEWPRISVHNLSCTIMRGAATAVALLHAEKIGQGDSRPSCTMQMTMSRGLFCPGRLAPFLLPRTLGPEGKRLTAICRQCELPEF